MKLLAAFFATLAFTVAAHTQEAAQKWEPTKPIEIVVHSAPGSGNDLLAREVIAIIERENFAPVDFRIVNKTGGGSTSAINYMHAKSGDDHVIGIGSNNWITDNLLQQETQYGLLDLTPVAVLGEDPFVLIVGADSPYQTLQDVVKDAHERKGVLSHAGSSQLSRDHLVLSNLMKRTDSFWNYVTFPSRGERAAALIGGHTVTYATDVIEASELVRGGRARAIGVFAPTRLSAFPDIPTITEVYKDVPHLASVRHVAAPPESRPEVVAYYADLFKRVTDSALWQDYSERNGFFSNYMGPTETRAFMEEHRDAIRDLTLASGGTVVR